MLSPHKKKNTIMYPNRTGKKKRLKANIRNMSKRKRKEEERGTFQ